MSIEKFSKDAATKTHGLVEANFIDCLNPFAELNDTGSALRTAVYGVGAWVARGYKDFKTLGF